MKRFLTRMLATPRRKASASRTARQARLRLEGMEDRLAPSSAVPLNPLVIRGFNPQPEPPLQVMIRQDAVTRGIISINVSNPTAVGGIPAIADQIFLAANQSAR